MSDDVLITPASRKIEFKDSSGNIDGKIELDGSGNLQITSTGLIGIGDTSEDIHIGDGTQAVDLVFDYASRLYSVANQDLTIGKSSLGGNDIVIDSPNWSVSSAGVASFASINGDLSVSGDFSGKSVNGAYSRLYRWGGIYFTWDSDTYGTQLDHSITSTDNGSWSDDLTINSYNKIRINMDTNNNNTDSYIQFGRHDTGTGGDTLMTLNDSGNLIINGTGVYDAPTLKINNSSDSTFVHGAQFIAANIDSGDTHLIVIGQDDSNNDAAWFGFKKKSASDGSADNILTMGLWNADHLITANGSGNVGIGTESPGQKLEVNNSGSAGDNVAMRLLAGNTGNSLIEFGDTDDADVGKIDYDHNNNTMTFTTNGSDRLTIYNNGVATFSAGVNFGGDINLQQATANPTIKVHADTDSSPAPRIEMMRGAHDTWGSGDNYCDWRIVNENNLTYYSGFSTQSSGATVERLKLYSDATGLEINDAYIIPGSAGTSGQVLKWPSSGTTLEWADESGGGGGSIDADTNLASNPTWTVTSTSGIGLYLTRNKDDANMDNDMIRIREDDTDADQASLYVLHDGGAQMNQQDFGRCFAVGAQSTGEGVTYPLQVVNGRNASSNYAGVGIKFKLSGWGNSEEGRKFSSIHVVSQTSWSRKHKMVFKVYGSASSNQDVDTAMTIKDNLEIDGNFNDTSDRALKSNIKTIPNGLGMIEQLNPVTFNWDVQVNNQPSAGFIAQEVEEVLPDLVNGIEGEKTIKTAGIVGYLVKAVQELSARVKELEGGN